MLITDIQTNSACSLPNLLPNFVGYLDPFFCPLFRRAGLYLAGDQHLLKTFGRRCILDFPQEFLACPRKFSERSESLNIDDNNQPVQFVGLSQ